MSQPRPIGAGFDIGAYEASFLSGDMDCDGDIDFDDIDRFVLGMTDPSGYLEEYAVPPTLKGDVDADGDLDFDDITGFVVILSGGLQPVPEPNTLLLLAVGALGCVGVAQRAYQETHP